MNSSICGLDAPDRAAGNCSCLPRYSHANTFTPVDNCAELRDVEFWMTLGEIVILAGSLLATLLFIGANKVLFSAAADGPPEPGEGPRPRAGGHGASGDAQTRAQKVRAAAAKNVEASGQALRGWVTGAPALLGNAVLGALGGAKDFGSVLAYLVLPHGAQIKPPTTVDLARAQFSSGGIMLALALAEKALVLAQTRASLAANVLFVLGFAHQVFMEWIILKKTENFADTMPGKAPTGVGKAAGALVKAAKSVTIGASLAASVALLVLLGVAPAVCDSYVMLAVASLLIFVLTVLLLYYLLQMVSALIESEQNVNDNRQKGGASLRAPIALLLNMAGFLALRLVVLLMVAASLAMGPGSNGQSLTTANFAWFVSTILFAHLVMINSLNSLLTQ